MADARPAPLARPGRPGGVGWIALGFLVGAALSLAGLVRAGLLRAPAHASAPLAPPAPRPAAPLPAPPAMVQAVEPAAGPTWSWTVPDAGPPAAAPLATAAAPPPAAPAPAAPALRQASASADVIADDAAAVGMTSRARSRAPG